MPASFRPKLGPCPWPITFLMASSFAVFAADIVAVTAFELEFRTRIFLQAPSRASWIL